MTATCAFSVQLAVESDAPFWAQTFWGVHPAALLGLLRYGVLGQRTDLVRHSVTPDVAGTAAFPDLLPAACHPELHM